MKKRVLALLLIAALLLAGCGKSGSGTWKPENVSRDIRPYVERAIDIIDSYLAFGITADEADDSFDELSDRLESMGVLEVDSKYSYTDTMAAFIVVSLTYEDADERTDMEFHQLRDVLVFYIGEDVSGKAYPVKYESDLFGDEIVPEYLQQFSAPAATAQFSVIDSKSYISLSFDAINGVQPSGLLSYINDLIDSIPENNKTAVVIDLTYKYYEQLVFGLRLTVDGTSITGNLTNLSNGNSVVAATVNSAAEIETALACGAKHLGSHKVPEFEESTTGGSAGAATVEYKKYPQEFISSQNQTELARIPSAPDVVYVTTGGENGLIGTMYCLYGTVNEHIENEHGFVEYFCVKTLAGDVIVSNPAAQFLYEESAAELGNIDKDALDKYYPTPVIGENVIIYASYEGFSNKYNCPHFLYGGQDYMLDIMLQFVF